MYLEVIAEIVGTVITFTVLTTMIVTAILALARHEDL